MDVVGILLVVVLALLIVIAFLHVAAEIVQNRVHSKDAREIADIARLQENAKLILASAQERFDHFDKLIEECGHTVDIGAGFRRRSGWLAILSKCHNKTETAEQVMMLKLSEKQYGWLKARFTDIDSQASHVYDQLYPVIELLEAVKPPQFTDTAAESVEVTDKPMTNEEALGGLEQHG